MTFQHLVKSTVAVEMIGYQFWGNMAENVLSIKLCKSSPMAILLIVLAIRGYSAILLAAEDWTIQ